MQLLDVEGIGQTLRLIPVVDVNECVVVQIVTDALAIQLFGQPTMPVKIKLQAKRRPRRHAQMAQAELFVDEVKVIVLYN